MTDDADRDWVKALFGPRRPNPEPSTDDPMREFARELFGKEGE